MGTVRTRVKSNILSVNAAAEGMNIRSPLNSFFASVGTVRANRNVPDFVRLSVHLLGGQRRGFGSNI